MEQTNYISVAVYTLLIITIILTIIAIIFRKNYKTKITFIYLGTLSFVGFIVTQLTYYVLVTKEPDFNEVLGYFLNVVLSMCVHIIISKKFWKCH